MKYTCLLLGICLGILLSPLAAQSTREVEDNTPVDEKRQRKIERRHRPNSKVKAYDRLKSVARLEKEYRKRVKRLAKVYGKYSRQNPATLNRYIQNFGHRRKPRIRSKKDAAYVKNAASSTRGPVQGVL